MEKYEINNELTITQNWENLQVFQKMLLLKSPNYKLNEEITKKCFDAEGIFELYVVRELDLQITVENVVGIKTILNKGNAFGYSEFFLNFIRTNINDIIK